MLNQTLKLSVMVMIFFACDDDGVDTTTDLLTASELRRQHKGQRDTAPEKQWRHAGANTPAVGGQRQHTSRRMLRGLCHREVATLSALRTPSDKGTKQVLTPCPHGIKPCEASKAAPANPGTLCGPCIAPAEGPGAARTQAPGLAQCHGCLSRSGQAF